MEIIYPDKFLKPLYRTDTRCDHCEEHKHDKHDDDKYDDKHDKHDKHCKCSKCKKDDGKNHKHDKQHYDHHKDKPIELPPKHKPPKCESCEDKVNPTNSPKYAVSGNALACCLDKLTYIWQNDGKEYWTYVFYVDKVCYVGWRWNKEINDWVYYGVDISKVETFSCKR
ncbi:hypothetical protein [uncultured Clostridium sp.]|uniref:hypothetical protein n=1 Tax=uncultured Clostridium sp. TaxID=59620 RepID=UPI002628996F|nr:hypothetical protein [uncultured Clostridium sp.]